MLRRSLVGIVLVAVLGLGGFIALAWRPSIAPIDPPPAANFSAERIAQGAVLAGAGYCATCHTAKGGKPYAGGYAMRTGFGTIYSTNITPDPGTGIGQWSEAAFRRAMHEGVARDGSHLFPAFPYDHFTKLTDEDVAALYAYFMTREPVVAPAHENELPFPLGLRPLQAGWKLLFFRSGRFTPDPAQSAEWNRGAYLALGISHCGACHTPRNLLGAEKGGDAYAGALVDNWIAPPLTKANPSPMPWDESELFAYLRNGVSHFHGTSAGPMAPVVSDGLARLPDADIHAIAGYFVTVNRAALRQAEVQPALQRAFAANKTTPGVHHDPASRLYTAACASCHYNNAEGLNPLRPDLTLNSAANLDDPTNLIRVMLYGIDAKDGAPGIVMPAFMGWSDADIARIASYLRTTRAAKAPWPDLEKKIATIRAEGKGESD
jgi:mono/diheme cytochrome c family protein